MTKFQKQMMTIAAIGALSAVTALPAMAADVNFYGWAAVDTFYNQVTNSVDNDTSGFDQHIRDDSRIGANFTNGAFGGKVELGFGDSGNASATAGYTTPATHKAVTLRLGYGTWNFGSGKLIVGQDWNRYTSLVNQVHGSGSGVGYGVMFDDRLAQIRVDMNNGFYFAAIKPNGNVVNNNQEIASTTAGTDPTGNSSYLPKLNVGYAGKAGGVTYNVGLVGQFYDYNNTATNSENIVALAGYLNGAATYGATTLKYNLAVGQNMGSMGFGSHLGYDTAKLDDTMNYEAHLQLTQKLSDTYSVNLGANYVYDKPKADGRQAEDKMLLFVNMPIQMAKYVTLTPEISYYDQLDESGFADSDNSKAQAWAIGANWKINF